MKTLILLIDFNGHKILVDEYINKLRYSTLQQIVSDDSIDRNETVICSIGNSGIDLKLIEIKKMAVVDGWKWLEINDAMSSIETIEKLVKEKLNFYMNNTDTEIVIGGCNTSGCVLKSKMSSAKYFAEKNYKTTILLPMCAEYSQHGINDIEKNMRAFGKVYTYIKNKKLNIDILDDATKLRFIRVNK